MTTDDELLRCAAGETDRLVLVDDEPRIRTVESAGWDPGRGSEGGSQIGNCVQLPPDEPAVLFRRRFLRPLGSGRSGTPNGPTEGLLLWIEPK